VGGVRDDRAAADLHLAIARCTSAHVAQTLRLWGVDHDGESPRAFLVPRSDDGAAAGAGQGQDPRRRIPYQVPSEAELPRRLHSSWRRLPHLQRGIPRRTRGTISSASTSCRGGPVSVGFLSELMPDEPESWTLALMLAP